MRNRPAGRLLEIETNIGLNRPMLKKTHFYMYFACRLYVWNIYGATLKKSLE